MGCVLLEGSDEPTLCLEDFVTQEKISTRSTPCTSNNVELVSALKNLQLSMQIVFSELFETCLDSFIENLEGAFRPMELVVADFLKHLVELVLSSVAVSGTFPFPACLVRHSHGRHIHHD
jgi:hypothetical protein